MNWLADLADRVAVIVAVTLPAVTSQKAVAYDHLKSGSVIGLS